MKNPFFLVKKVVFPLKVSGLMMIHSLTLRGHLALTLTTPLELHNFSYFLES